MKNKFNLLFAVAVMVIFAACSKDSENGILSRLPVDADVVGIVNMKGLVESAGGTIDGDHITTPEYIKENDGTFCEKYNGSGLNLNTMGLWEDDLWGAGKEMLTVFAVDDAAKLESFLAEKGYTESENAAEYKFYTGTDDEYDANCATGHGFAYFYESNDSNDDVAKRLDKAASKPVYGTPFGKYISEDNAGGIVIKSDKFPIPARLCIKGNISADEATIKTVLLDENGKNISLENLGLEFDAAATISADALAYIPPSEFLVYAMALKNVNWDDAFEKLGKRAGFSTMKMMMLGMVKEYFNKIDGTVAIGFGFEGKKDELMRLSEDMSALNYIPFTIVIQTKPGQAKGFIGDISAVLATMGMSPTQLGDGFSAHIFDNACMLYGKAEGNTVVFSTRPIEKYNSSGAVKPLKGYLAGLGVSVPADYPLAADFGVKDNLDASAIADLKEANGTIRIKITGETKGGIVERIIRMYKLYVDGSREILRQTDLDSDFTPDIYED